MVKRKIRKKVKKKPIRQIKIKPVKRKLHLKSPSKSKRKILAKSKINEMATDLSENQAHQKQVSESLGALLKHFKKSGSFEKVTAAEEGVALSLVYLYFKEIADQNFKNSLEVDDIINSYFYALARVKRQEFEAKEIMRAFKK